MKDGYATKDIDLSELQLAYFTYNFVTDSLGGTAGDTSSYANNESSNYLNKGGNFVYASRRLMQWISPTDETTVPYSNAADTLTNGLNNSYAYNKTNYHLSNVYLININENRDELKQQILEHGAAGVAYYHDLNNYSNKKSEDGRYAFYDTGVSYTNHAVMIVGWDDNYSVDNFTGTNKPTNSGAWLIRNSWGDSLYSYFWMSYETSSLTTTAYIFDFTENDGLDNNYQLDGGINAGWTYAAGSDGYANVFSVNAKDNVDYELLSNVSLSLTHDANVGYTIEIYTDLTDGSNPLSGTKQESAKTEGQTAFAGVYTVKLTNPVKLKPNSKFAVVVTLSSNSDSKVYMDVEYAGGSSNANWTSTVSGSNKQSFTIYGTSANVNSERNYCIKAYTTNVKENTVTYNLDGGTNATENLEKISTLDGEVTLSNPTKTGYTFEGWYDSDDNKVEKISASKNYTLTAKWKVIEYTITYNNMDGANNNSENPSSVTYEDSAKTLKDPTMNGYTFLGWYSDSEFNNEVTEIPAQLTSSYALYAKWEKIVYKYTITYNNVEGATNDNPSGITSEDSALTLKDASKSGYKFDGWYEDEGFNTKITTIPANPSKDYTLYAKWLEVYKVTYKYSGDTKYDTPTNVDGTYPENTEYVSGKTVTIPSTLSSSDKNSSDGTRGSWSFAWDVTESFKITKDTTITGTWTFTPVENAGQAGYYLVASDATWETKPSGLNDGVNNKYFYTNKLTKGDTFTVIADKPVREGYVFVGWFDKERTVNKEVVSGATIRNAGSDVTYLYEDGKDYCLDALWGKLSVTGGTYKYSGASHQISESFEIDYSSNNGWSEAYADQAKGKIEVVSTRYSYKDNEWSETSPSFKDAGTYTVKVEKTVKVGETETVLKDEATIVIKPFEATVKTDSATRAYNGEKLTADGSFSGFANDEEKEKVKFSVTGSQTNVGESTNTYSIDWNGVNENNYKITEELGTLKVTPASGLTISVKDASKIYDGEKLEVNATAYIGGASTISVASDVDDDIIITYSINDGASYSTSVPSITNVGTLNVRVKATKANYTSAEASYKLTVTQRPITFTGKSATETYTGSELKVEGFDISANSLLSGSTTNVEASASGIDAKEYTGTITAADKVVIKNASGDDVTSNYKITTIPGKLTINRASNLDLQVENGEWIYDGDVHSKVATSSVPGTTITYSTDGGATYKNEVPSITNKGEITVKAKASNPNYEDVTKDFTLKVTARTVSFTGETATKTYTGSKIVLNGLTENGLVNGHTHNVVATSEGTNVGEYDGKITAKDAVKIYSGNEDVTNNYSITTTPGKLTISARPVIDISATGASKMYDGKELSVAATSSISGATIEYSINGESYSKTVPSITDVGEITVTARASKEGYESSTVEYTLEVTRRPISFTGESDVKTYTGDEIKLTKVNVGGSGLVNGHKANVEATVSGTDAHTYDGTITAKDDVKIMDGNKDVTSNYDITTKAGILTITPLSVTVTINGKTDAVSYDGNRHSLSGYEVECNNKLYSEDYISYVGSNGVTGINADKYVLALDKNDFGNTSNNFKVTFVVNNGLLTINKAKLVVTTPSASKTYDGKVLEAGGTIKGFVNDESAAFTTTGKQLVVGSSKNTYSIDWTDATANKDNYTIEEHLGTLTVNAVPDPKKDENSSSDIKAVTCEEAMNSKDWTWSESKKACVYKVSNTSSN